MRVVDDDRPAEVIDGTPTTVTSRTPWFRRRGTLIGIALALAVTIAALVFTNGRADQKAVDASVSQSDTTMPDGEYKTIADYIAESQITSTPVPRAEDGGDPGAPIIGMGLLAGYTQTCRRPWCRTLGGFGGNGRRGLTAEASARAYGAVQWESSVDPNDPPIMVVLLDKLTGAVDPAKILEYAPGELKNLPNYEPLAEDDSSSLGGYKAVQLAGRYSIDGEVRSIGQKTVVLPREDATYVLQIIVESLDADAETLARVTSTVDELTVIDP